MTEKISININLTKKRIVAMVLAVYFCLLGASYFGLHRAQDDWQIAYLRWDQATLISGEIVDIKALKASLKALVEGYFLELRQKWEDSGKTVVRLSQVTMRLLEGEGVLDVSGVTLNGAAVNVETGELEVPVLGQVSLTME